MTHNQTKTVVSILYGIKTSEDIRMIEAILDIDQRIGEGKITAGELYKLSRKELQDLYDRALDSYDTATDPYQNL